MASSAWFIDSISQVTGSIWILLIIRCLTAEEMTHREVIFRGLSEVAELLWPLKLSSQNIKCPSYSQTLFFEEYECLSESNHCSTLVIACTDGKCTGRGTPRVSHGPNPAQRQPFSASVNCHIRTLPFTALVCFGLTSVAVKRRKRLTMLPLLVFDIKQPSCRVKRVHFVSNAQFAWARKRPDSPNPASLL